MKVKIRNVLILLLEILVFGTILCNNQVNAAETTKEQEQAILDLIPNEIALDIPEIEYEKAESIILKNIQEILKNNNIEVSRLNIYGPNLWSGIHNAEIRISGINGIKKNIELTYNNQGNYNVNDEKYVKNLKIEKVEYFGIDVEEITSNSFNSDRFATEYYTNLLNDDTIVLKYIASAGGGAYISYGNDAYIGIFKNDILYNVIYMGEHTFIPVINIPSTINDNEVNDYVIGQLEKYYKYEMYDVNITDIKKGIPADEIKNIDNGYTIFYNDGIQEYVIVKREELININSQDTTTNIKLETNTSVVPEDTTLVVEKITIGDFYNIVVVTLGDTIDKFVLYDITLKSNGVEVQPNGKVKISIPIPDGFNKEKLAVYRINEDGTKVKYDVKIEIVEGKDYATFKTDHFSLYTLALDSETTNTEDNSNNNNILDETPKTGNIVIHYILAVVIVVALVGMTIIKKKNK